MTLHSLDDPQVQLVLTRALVCRLALSAADQPYLVPVNFGFEGGELFFHSGPGGKKLEMLAVNPRVCFELETDVELLPSISPCNFSMRYRSLIGYGSARRLESEPEKRRGLDAIIRQYGGEPGKYGPGALAGVEVYAILVERIDYKQHHIE